MRIAFVGKGGSGKTTAAATLARHLAGRGDRDGAAPDLEPANRAVLDAVVDALDARPRDWAAFHRATVEFHLRNAASWANAAVGADLADQVDREFVPGPVVPSAVR